MNEQYRRLFELSIDPLCLTDDERFRDVNPSFERLLGYTREELLGPPVSRFIHPEDIEATATQCALVRQTGETVAFENRYIKKDGGEVRLLWKARFCPTDGLFYASAVDVSRRHQNDRETAEREIRLQFALKASAMGTWSVEVDRDHVDWSPETYRMFGLPVGAPLNTEIFLGLIHPEDSDRVRAAAMATLQNGTRNDIEYRVVWPDSSVHWLHAQGDCYWEREGDLTSRRVVGTVHNIDARKKLEHERDEFLSVAAHELKTPLTPLLLGVDLIEQTLNPVCDARTHQIIDTFRNQVTRLSRLVSELLDIGRAQSRKLELQKARFQLSDLLYSVVGQFESQLQASRIKPTLQGPLDVAIHGDSFRLEQVFVNLLANALKYAPSTPIEIEWTRTIDCVSVRVTDHGPGVPPADRARIFEKFARATSSRHFAGLGLGLFISRTIVEAHGGTIRCESEPGKFTTFTVTLPA